MFEAGEGAPLLWLHGSQGVNPKQEFVPLFSARRRLIVPSHPGFGQSGLPDWLDSIDDIAHIYLELLDTLGLDKVDIVGCSIGGWIAAEMATKVAGARAPAGHGRSRRRQGRLCRTSSTFPTSSRCRRRT